MNGSTTATESKDEIYHIKWIHWKDDLVPIVTQNSNGPCPLISMTNVLLLRGGSNEASKCGFKGSETVLGSVLLEYLGNALLQSASRSMSDEDRLNYEANTSDAINILPVLQKGLDVNVKFTGVRDFEYTKEILPFDLLNISLYHGWLVDPQSEESKVIGDLSYNALVEKVISQSAYLGKHFLEASASQLTYHGLCELTAALEEGEIGVFFRNNHFSTLTKAKGRLYLLVTDQGFLKEASVVWETLDSVDGDITFVDEGFKIVSHSPEQQSSQYPPTSSPGAQSNQQIEQDHQLAMSVQEESYREGMEASGEETPTMSDAEIAQRLQNQEIEAAERSEAAGSRRPGSRSSGTRSVQRGGEERTSRGGGSLTSNIKKNCCIS